MRQIHRDLLFAAVVTAIIAVLSVMTYSHVFGTLVTHKEKHYLIQNIFLKVTINGHELKMELDTGSDISTVYPNDAKKLGIGELPGSEMMTPNQKMYDANGHKTIDEAKDVIMCLGGHCFPTVILIDSAVKANVPLLSLHDYMEAFPTHAL